MVIDSFKIFDAIVSAIDSSFRWFEDLMTALNMTSVIATMIIITMAFRFLLLPFFQGVIHTGVSDSVQRVTRTGRHSAGYKNQQAFYKSKSAYYDRKVQNYYNSKRK